MERSRINAMQCDRFLHSYHVLKTAQIENPGMIRQLCRKLPIFIQTTGALETMLYLKRKASGDGHSSQCYKTLYQAVESYFKWQEWLPEEDNICDWMMEKYCSNPFVDYRIVTSEFKELSICMKRAAEGMFDEKERDS